MDTGTKPHVFSLQAGRPQPYLFYYPSKQRAALTCINAKKAGYVLTVGKALPLQVLHQSGLLAVGRYYGSRQIVPGSHLCQLTSIHQLLEPMIGNGLRNVQQRTDLIPGCPALPSDLGENLPRSAGAQGLIYP